MAKRFIWWGGTRERNSDGTIRTKGVNENSAFKFGAFNIRNSYQSFGDEIILQRIDTARHIVDELNSQSTNSMKSLDIVSHGTPVSLNFSKIENENCGFYVGSIGKFIISRYYSWDQEDEYKFTVDSRSVADINYNIFTDNARIQLHGCLTASAWFATTNGERVFPVLIDNIVEEMSELLFKANKKNAVVIGHATKGNPNINDSNTTLIQQDYRHGHRVVYHNGNVLFETMEKGYLNQDIISKHLSRSSR